ncbi:ribosomal protein S12 methylthiotransferase accessory factor [Rhizobium sp. BK650]|uniref:YcaO-like family protein n=1 Tax=Rhizobium sp. BK650 TaxID=2586990 RepID=UPI001621FEBC|nr:YcaO-like family protein [Rhizobium sp. BK650]MBB3659074.1 ribosomal protein S12 methylthiotransferase accessory factor [Rhizobium sp. BK650]
MIAYPNPYSDRTIAPQDTLSRVAPYLRTMGITRMSRQTGLDCVGLPVWCAYTPNSRSIVVAQGKGLEDIDAKVSAAMEALERAVAGDPVTINTVSSARDLRRQAHVEPLDCLIASGEHVVSEDEELTWSLAMELLGDQPIHVPRDAALLDRTRHNRFWMSSDGLASGNTMEEAMFHGILERIERDAQVLWQIVSDDKRDACCVDPRSFADPSLTGLIDRIEAAGLVAKLFDITSDIGIPCYTALVAPPTINSKATLRFVEVTGGSGAHLWAVRAAIRAVTEALQSRLTYIGGARDDVLPGLFKTPLPAQTRSAFLAVPSPVSTTERPAGSVSTLLHQLLGRLRASGIGSVIALPLTPADLPFSVVKMFIPDLENPEGNRLHRFGKRALAKAICA